MKADCELGLSPHASPIKEKIMADEKDPNASGPSEEGILIPDGALVPEGVIMPDGALIPQAGGPSESTEGVIVNQAEQPGDDERPQKDALVIEF